MKILTLVAEIVLLTLIGSCAYCDIKNKTIPVILIISGLISGIVFQTLLQQMSLWAIISGSGIGLFLLGIAFLSKQKIGYGDGLVFVTTGIFLGFYDNLWLLIISLGISMIVGLIMLVVGKFNGKASMPFAPCILCGYLGLLAVG